MWNQETWSNAQQLFIPGYNIEEEVFSISYLGHSEIIADVLRKIDEITIRRHDQHKAVQRLQVGQVLAQRLLVRVVGYLHPRREHGD